MEDTTKQRQLEADEELMEKAQALEACEKRCEDLNEKLHHFELVYKDIQSDKERLEDNVKVLEKRLSEVNTVEQHQKVEITELHTELKERREKVRALDTECYGLRTNVAELSDQLLDFQSVHTKLLDENQRLLRDVSDLETQLKISQSEVVCSNDELAEVQQAKQEQVRLIFIN